jgi:hypothetical protein
MGFNAGPRDEIETWMSAPPQDALKLQGPLPDDILRIAARGERSDDIAAERAGEFAKRTPAA